MVKVDGVLSNQLDLIPLICALPGVVLYKLVTFDVFGFFCRPLVPLASFGCLVAHLIGHLYVLMYYPRRLLVSFGAFWCSQWLPYQQEVPEQSALAYRQN